MVRRDMGVTEDVEDTMDRVLWWGETWRWQRMWRTQWTGCYGEERHGGDRGCGGHSGQSVMVRRDMEVTEDVEDTMDRVLWWGETWRWQRLWRTQWTECHGEERHGGDRGCGGHNGQGVMVRRDMEVTEVVEDTMDRVSWWGETWRWQRMWRTQWTGCHGEERHGGDWGCGGHNGQGVMVRRDMEVTEVVEDTVDRVSWLGETWRWQRLWRRQWTGCHD